MVKVSNFLLLCGFALVSACGNAAPNNETAQETFPPTTQEVNDPEHQAASDTAPRITPPDTNSEVRQADSHTHGDANLAIVLEGSALTIELETPLFNLTGFEHAPETAEQMRIIEEAEARLAKPEMLFQVNAQANCTPVDTNLDIHLGEDSHDEHGDHEEEHHDEEADDLHQDVLLTYSFQCADQDKLSDIDIALLRSFPNMSELEVAWLGPSAQRVYALDQTNTKVNLRP